MYQIDVRASLSVLFNRDFAKGADVEALLEMLSSEEKREWDYFLNLLGSANWYQYYSKYPEYSLRCIKRNTNQITKEHISHRLFFLVNHQTGRIVILINKRVSSTSHTTLQHLKTVDDLVTKNHDVIAFDREASFPALPLESRQQFGSSSLNEKQEDVVLGDINVANLEEKFKNSLMSRAKVEGLFYYLSTQENWSDIWVRRVIDVFNHPRIHIAFVARSKKLFLQLAFGEQGQLYELPLSDKSTPAGFITQLIEAVPCHSPNYFATLLSSLSCHKEALLDFLAESKDRKFDIDRGMMNRIFIDLISLLESGRLGYNDLAQCMLWLASDEQLQRLERGNLNKLIQIWMMLISAERFLSEKTVSSSSSSSSSSTCVTTSAVIKQLRRNKGITVSKAKLHNFFLKLMPVLNIEQYRIIFRDEYDLIGSEKLLIILDLTEGLGYVQKLELALLWDKNHPKMDAEQRGDNFTTLRRQYDRCSQEEQKLALNRLSDYRDTLLNTAFSDLLPAQVDKSSESTSSDDLEKKAKPVSSSSSAIVEDGTVMAKKEKTKKKKPVPKSIDDFRVLFRRAKKKEISLKDYVKTVGSYLQPYTKNALIDFQNDELDAFFVDDFLSNDNAEGIPNLIELAAYDNYLALVDLLCRYAMAKNPEILSVHNKKALMNAVKNTNVQLVELLLYTYNYDPNYQDDLKHTPIFTLLSHNENRKQSPEKIYRVLRVLIKAGADVNRYNFEGISPLHMACVQAYPYRIIKALLEGGADATYTFEVPGGEKISCYDAYLGIPKPDSKVRELLLQYGAYMSRGPTMSTSAPLDSAAARGERTMVRVITDHPSLNKIVPPKQFRKVCEQMKRVFKDMINDRLSVKKVLDTIEKKHLTVNYTPEGFGFTVIHKAIMDCDFHSMNRILNQHRPNLYRQIIHKDLDDSVGTYVHFAINIEKTDFLPMLIEHGAPLMEYDSNGLAPIHCAVKKGDLLSIRRLVNAGANALQETKDGITMAAYCNSVDNHELFKFLLKYRNGVPDISLLIGSCPEFLARQFALYGDVDALNVLIAIGTNMNALSDDNAKNTVMHQACRGRSDGVDVIIINLLAAQCCDVLMRNTKGKTPLNLFLQRGHYADKKKETRRAQAQKLLSAKHIADLQEKGNLDSKFVMMDANGEPTFFKTYDELKAYAALQQAGTGCQYDVYDYRRDKGPDNHGGGGGGGSGLTT